MSDDMHGFPVVNFNQMKPLIDHGRFFCEQQFSRKVPDQIQHFLMGVNICLSPVFSMDYELTDHADHPDHAEQMIDMFMRHKQMADIHPVITGMLYLTENGIPSAAVNHQQLSVIIQNKAGI